MRNYHSCYVDEASVSREAHRLDTSSDVSLNLYVTAFVAAAPPLFPIFSSAEYGYFKTNVMLEDQVLIHYAKQDICN